MNHDGDDIPCKRVVKKIFFIPIAQQSSTQQSVMHYECRSTTTLIPYTSSRWAEIADRVKPVERTFLFVRYYVLCELEAGFVF